VRTSRCVVWPQGDDELRALSQLRLDEVLGPRTPNRDAVHREAAAAADGPLASQRMPRTAAPDERGRSAKWEARRAAIIDTSARVFARQGYHATGTAELCAANDLGKGALYHYIGSKEELLAAIHDRVMDEVMAGADRVREAGGSPSAQLAMLGDELLDVIHRYPDHVWVFLHEFPALTGDRAEQFRGRRRQYERRVEAVLQAGVDSGEFRDLDPRLTAMAWLGMHNYTYLWLRPGGRLSARDVAKPFAEIFMRGIEKPTPDPRSPHTT
jgi:AcrR family transcriptional regulator